MNSLTAVILLVAVAAANASGILGHHGVVIGHDIHGVPGTVTGLGAPAVLSGPAGTVVRGGVAPAPAVVAGHGVGVVGHAGVIGHAGLIGHAGIIGPAGIVAGHGLLGHGLIAPGSGLEGQWIPDINEKLYDDGSYKPHIYGH
ncbi:collagen alpha-1(X) chain-like [Tribolium madens]|uniref:collagen alpha-1(X) chain-like n=1 Tax=Tribolium madens TaxID=41895 RepID=UPI001CF740CF|nr:collagen alpha-1(X) chain-like [Tribolium madens]